MMTLGCLFLGLLPLLAGFAHTSGAALLGGDSGSLGTACVTTFGGPIRLAEAPQGVSLRSFGGDVAVGRTGGAVKATSYGGDIRLAAVEGDVRATSFGGDIVVALKRAESRSRRVTLKSF